MNGLDLKQLLFLDPAEGDRSIKNLFPYLATKRWVYDQRLAWWQGSESSSPKWMSRVMAQFPDEGQNALFKIAWLERAKRRAQVPQAGDGESSRLIAGVDVSGSGDAETVVYTYLAFHL